MYETNTNNSLISLARAAQLTGYHQDYLGQLCRLGRLPAKKVGRNWFTSSEALDSLTAISEPPQEVSEPEEAMVEMAPPAVAQSITISQVDELPITIQTIPRPVQNSNNVQAIITTLRIESLQKEVADLREMLSRLMAEVTRHSHLLEGRVPAEVARIQDSLRHRYASNFDFNQPALSSPVDWQEPEEAVSPPQIWIEQVEPRYSIATLVSATAALIALAFILTGMITGSFWGPAPVELTQTVYYHQKQVAQPEVAGATDQTLPTDSLGQ